MDYLDPQKEFRHRVVLLVGYVLVAIAILIATLILLYQAYGFGLAKNGTVIQNGLAFFSSRPSPADIYINGKLASAKTNTRLVLPAGLYDVTLARAGYYDWHRKIDLAGGIVEHYDYPFLFPKTVSTKKVQSFTAAPGFMTSSPDHRWLLIQPAGPLNDFTMYDLKTKDKAPTTISLPPGLLSKATGAESWQMGEWADDNQHLLLQHLYDGKMEFILIDRSDPTQSQNLNTVLSINPTQLTLIDKKYDRYYIYDAAAHSVQSVALKTPTPTPVLQHVLAYKSYSDNTLLYVTDSGAPADKVLVKLMSGSQTSTVRSLSAGTSYVVDLTKYSGVMYVAAGSASDKRVYIYKDPAGQISKLPDQPPTAAQVLHVDDVNYLSFSANAQFVVAENATKFGVYDIENSNAYTFHTSVPLDGPQTHASWMDGNRLVYAGNGKLLAFDYDSTNQHVLMPAISSYLPAFTPDYKYVYALAPSSEAGHVELTQTALVTPADK